MKRPGEALEALLNRSEQSSLTGTEEYYDEEDDNEYTNKDGTLILNKIAALEEIKVDVEASRAKFMDYFSGVEVPNLLENYDAVGFDTCLVKYTPEMAQLVIQTY